MRKNIVKILFTLTTALNIVPSYAEFAFPEITADWEYDGVARYLLTTGTAETGYDWQCKTTSTWKSTSTWRPQIVDAQEVTCSYQLVTTSGYATVTGMVGSHCYVDLGLPSGTLWASYDVGSKSPVSEGLYFPWADTKGEATYSVSDGTHKYKDEDGYTKYYTSDGSADKTKADFTVLQTSDDAAYVNWGSLWEMPTNEQWEELTTNLTWSWTTDYNKTGLAGAIGTAENGASIFFIAGPNKDGERGYWTKELCLENDGTATNGGYMQIISKNVIKVLSNYLTYADRTILKNVRAVVKTTDSKKILPATKTWTAKVSKKAISITKWGQSEFEYDGKEHAPTPTVSGIVTADADLDIVVVSGAKKAVGEDYVAKASLNSAEAKSKNYTLASTKSTTTFSIVPRTITWAPENQVSPKFNYDGEYHKPKVGVWQTSFVSGEDANLVVTGEQKNPGDYEATVSIEGDDKDNYKLTNTVCKFSIVKNDPTIALTSYPKAVTTNEVDYDGTKYSPITAGVVGAKDTPGKWQYYTCTDGKLDETKFADTITKVKNAGTYITYYRFVPKDNVGYSIVNDLNTVTFVINPKSITLDYISSYVYNGKEQKPLSATPLGVVEGDVVTVKLTGDGKVNVNTNYSVTASLTGTSASNYKLASTSVTYRITRKELTNTWAPVIFEYDGESHVPSTTFTGLVGTDQVEVEVSGEETEVGTDYVATATLTGSHKDNYKLTSSSTTFEIGKNIYNIEWPISALDGSSATYNGTKYTLLIPGAVSGEIQGTFLYNLNGGEFSTSLPEAKDADVYSVGYKFVPKNSKYAPTTPKYMSLWIERARAEFKCDCVVPYDGEAHQPNITITAFGTDVVTATVISDPQTEVGDYIATFRLSGKDAGNYKLSNAGSLEISFSIESTTLDYVAPQKVELTYDGEAHNLVVAGKEGKTKGTFTYAVGSGTYSTKIPSETAVGDYTIKWKFTPTNTKLEAEEGTVISSIGKKDVNVVWTEPTFTYNGTSQKPTASLSGVLKGEVAGVNVLFDTVNDVAYDGIKAGKQYVKTSLTGDDAKNYKISSTTATYSYDIAPKEVYITWSNTTMTCTAKPQAPTATLTGQIKGDNVTVVVSGEQTLAGTYTATAKLSGTDAGNYKITDKTVSTKFTINPETIDQDLSLSRSGWEYGEDPSEFKAVTGNKCEGEVTYTYYTDEECTKPTSTLNGASASGKLPSKPGKYYLKAVVAAKGTCASASVTTSFVISKRTIKPTWSNTSFVYDGLSHIATAKLAGIVGEDNVSLTVTGAQVNVGKDYKATATLTGTDAGNYLLAEDSDYANFTIQPKEISIEWGKTTLTYNGNPQTPTATLVGVVSGDVVTAVLSGAKTEVSDEGESYVATATLGGKSAANYTLLSTTASTKFVINKASASDYEEPKVITGLKYTGLPQALVLDGTSGEVPGIFKFAIGKEAEFAEGVPTGTTAGDYLVGYQFVPNDYNYAPSEPVYKTVTISPIARPLKWGETELLYNGKAQNPTAQLLDLIGDDIVNIEYTGSETNVGEGYIATASLAGVDAKNYVISSETSNSIEYSIIKSNVSDFKKPTLKQDLVYNGSSQELINEGKAQSIAGTFLYALGATGEFTTDIPVAKTAGTYTVGYKFVPTDKGYTESTPVYSTVKIASKEISIEWGVSEFVFDGEKHSPTATLKGTMDGDEVVATVIGAKSEVGSNYEATAVLSGKDVANYTISDAKLTAEFSILTRTIDKPVISQTEFVFDGTTIVFIPESSYYKVTGFSSAIEPGTYPVKVIPSTGCTWKDGTVEALEASFEIKKVSVDIPARDTRTFVYNGLYQTYELKISSAYSISGDVQRKAGTYDVLVSLVDKKHYEWSDNTTEDKSYSFVISKGIIKTPKADSVLTYIYDGVEKEFGLTVYPGSILADSNAVGTDAGVYIRTVALDMDENGGYEWSDNTTLPKEFKFEIKPQPVIIPKNIDQYFIYNGTAYKFIVPEDTAKVKRYSITMEKESAVGPGTFPATLSLINKVNYIWSDNTSDDREIIFTISDGKIAKPEFKTTYSYTGEEIVFATSTSAYTVEGGEGTNAGTYTVTITPKANYAWLDGTKTPMTVTVKIVEMPIEKPVIVPTTFTYSGEELFRVPTSDYYDLAGDTFGVEPGKYKATLSLKPNYMWKDSTKADVVFNLEITKIKVEIPDPDLTVYTYNGKEQTYKFDVNPVCVVTGNKHTDAGNYTVNVSINSKYHQWSDNTEEPKEYKFAINIAKIPVPVVSTTSFVFDGTPQHLEIVKNDNYVVDPKNETAVNVGSYERTVALADKTNCTWADGTTDDKVYNFEIVPQSVIVPTVHSEYQYTGLPITFVEESPAYTATNSVKTDAGEYEVTITLNPGYVWKEGTTDEKVFSVEIKPLYVPVPDVDEVTLEYNGKKQSFGFKSNPGYTFIGDTAATEPGVYVVTVKLNKNYIWDNDKTDNVDYKFVISKIDVQIPVANTTKFIYNGNEQTYTVVIPEDSLFTINNNVKTAAGSYVVNVSLKDSAHYVWADTTIADKLYDFVINKGKVALPTAPLTNMIYDKKEKSFVVNPSDLYVVADSNAVGTMTGTYTRTATLVDPINYTWVDETVGVKEIVFTIGDGSIDSLKIQTEYTYTGDTIIFVPEDGSYTVINGAKREVGTYKVVVIPNEGYRWRNGGKDAIDTIVVIKPIMVEIPTLPIEYTYNGKIIDFKVPVNAAYDILGDVSAKDLGKYKVTLNLHPNYMWADSTLEPVSYVFSINKKVIPIPTVDTTYFIYNGKRQTYNIAKSLDYNVLGNVQAYAGSYEVSVLLTDFSHSIWSDSTTEVKTYIFDIARAKVALPQAVQGTFSYDGTTKYFAVTENSRYEVLSKNASAIEVGNYDRTVALKDTLNYTWIDDSVTDKVVSFTITNGLIEYPTVLKDTVFTGSPISFVPENNAYTVENGTQTEAGTYNVVVKLKEGYLWIDNTRKDTSYTVRIKPIVVAKPVFPITTTYTYNDTLHGVQIAESSAYVINGTTMSKEPGIYNITVALNPNHVWADNTFDTLSYTYKINKIFVEIPAKCDSVFKFTGSEVTYPIVDTLDYYTVYGHHRASAGLHYVTISLTDSIHYAWTDSTSSSKIYEFLIDKNIVQLPYALEDSFIYDGDAKLFDIVENENYIVERTNASATEVGVYERKVSLVDTINFLWPDGTIEDKTVKFYITKDVIPFIQVRTDLVYTGDTIILIKPSVAYTLANHKKVAAGIYDVEVIPNRGYRWADSTTESVTYSVRIWPKKVEIPRAVTTTFFYNTKPQTYNLYIPEDSTYTVTGNVHTGVGEYTVVATLKDTMNYWWSDSTITSKSYQFNIINKTLYIDPISQSTDTTYESTPGHYVELNVNIISGNVYKYWIKSDSCHALDVDTTDLTSNPTSLLVYVPDTVQPGIYKIEVGFMSGTLIHKEIVEVKVNYPAANIYMIWDDVLAIDNGNDLFKTYQWYKNGQPIKGATKQYYQDNAGLDGSYMCLVNDELFIGPLYMHAEKPLWIKAWSNAGSGTLNVELVGRIPLGTQVGIYTISSDEFEVRNAVKNMTFELPNNIYIVRLIGQDPTVNLTNQAVKVIVK